MTELSIAKNALRRTRRSENVRRGESVNSALVCLGLNDRYYKYRPCLIVEREDQSSSRIGI